MAGELVLATLSHAWDTLHACGIDACVMGGLALAHWGYVRFTKDVDFLALVNPDAADDLVFVLAKEGFMSRRQPAIAQVGQHAFMQFMYRPGGRFEEIAVDLLVADSDFLRTALQRAVDFRIDQIEYRVVGCEDLILLKLQAGRMIDRADVRYLLEYNRPNLDFNQLMSWVQKLAMEKEWRECWEAAFPGENVPAADL